MNKARETYLRQCKAALVEWLGEDLAEEYWSVAEDTPVKDTPTVAALMGAAYKAGQAEMREALMGAHPR